MPDFRISKSGEEKQKSEARSWLSKLIGNGSMKEPIGGMREEKEKYPLKKHKEIESEEAKTISFFLLNKKAGRMRSQLCLFFIVSWILGGYFEHVFEDEGVLPDLVTKWHLLTRAEEGHNNNNVRRNAKLKHAMVGKKPPQFV